MRIELSTGYPRTSDTQWTSLDSPRFPPIPTPGLAWQRRAASIGAYRELSGHHHPADPIGTEPATVTPELRAAWNDALADTAGDKQSDVRGMPDGMLLHLRDTYPLETA